MNGPVPIEVLVAARFESSWAWPMMPTRALPQRNHGNAAHGVFVVTVTVSGSTTSTLAMLWNMNVNSSGVPRRVGAPVGVEVVLHDGRVERGAVLELDVRPELDRPLVLSAFGVTDSARNGLISPFSSGAVSVS